MPLNKNLEPRKQSFNGTGVETHKGQPNSEVQPPKLMVSRGRDVNPRDILAQMAANPRANLYLT